jgi:tetratricopeptide (TPR) repeat protein
MAMVAGGEGLQGAWPVLQLDLAVQSEGEAMASAEHEGREHARQLRLGLVPPPDFGVVARAIEWLEAGKQSHAKHEFEQGVVALNNAVAIIQLELRKHADVRGVIHRSGDVGGAESIIGPLADDGGGAHDPVDVGVLLDACFMRAACYRGMGMVDDALRDIDRLIGWHRRGPKIAQLHALRALCQFEALRVPAALDDARRAVSLAPDSRHIQDLLAELVAYTTTALGEQVTAASRGGVSLRYVRLRGHEIFHEVGGDGYVLYEIGIRLPALQPDKLSGWSALEAAREAEVTVYKRFSEVLDLHIVLKAAIQSRPPDLAPESPPQGRMASFGVGFGGGAAKSQPPKMPRPPSRMLLATRGKFDEGFLRERSQQLQVYFDALLEVPGIDTMREFLEFFAT